MASAAGDRVKLGQGPPSKTFEDLLTLKEMECRVGSYLTCLDKDDLEAVTGDFKPAKKALQEILVLGNGSAKDLKGAVVAATKWQQQEVDLMCKRRKVTAADPNKPVPLFEFVPSFSGDGKERLCLLVAWS